MPASFRTVAKKIADVKEKQNEIADIGSRALARHRVHKASKQGFVQWAAGESSPPPEAEDGRLLHYAIRCDLTWVDDVPAE